VVVEVYVLVNLVDQVVQVVVEYQGGPNRWSRKYTTSKSISRKYRWNWRFRVPNFSSRWWRRWSFCWWSKRIRKCRRSRRSRINKFNFRYSSYLFRWWRRWRNQVRGTTAGAGGAGGGGGGTTNGATEGFPTGTAGTANTEVVEEVEVM
jgi:hypothetical protein